MEYRQLGGSGLKVPVLSFGTATFGGGGDFFRAWGATDVAEASRLIDICLEAGVNFFDTADVYSSGASEEILGKALKGRRLRLGGQRTSRTPRDAACLTARGTVQRPVSKPRGAEIAIWE